MHKRARFLGQIYVVCGTVFSSLVCLKKDLWIQFANVSVQDRSERFFDTTLRNFDFRTPTHHKNAALNVCRQENKKSLLTILEKLQLLISVKTAHRYVAQ